MSKIQTGRYEQFTRRLLRLVGGSIMPLIQNDLSPVLNIEDPADDALLFWKGHRLANGQVTGTANATEFAACSIFNPLGSGSLIWVRQIRPGLAGSQWDVAFTQNRTAAVSSSLFFSDSRASLTSVPKAELGFDSLAALPSLRGYRLGGNSGTSALNLTPRFVLAPGVGLQIIDQVAATTNTVSFEWIERSAEVSELDSA